MAKWTIVGGPRNYEPSGGADAAVGWAWDLERDGEQVTVSVEVSRTAGNVSSVAEEATRAIRTRGKSAIDLWLDEETLPERIVVHTEGVSRPPSGDQ
jgi:hypothetical protein